MKTYVDNDLKTLRQIVHVCIDQNDYDTNMSALMHAMISKISDAVATEYVKQHYQEIVAKIDPQAIANLCIANGAAKINATLNKKLPDVVKETVREIVTPIFLTGVGKPE